MSRPKFMVPCGFGELELEPLDGGQARSLRGVLFLLRHDGSFLVARNHCLG